jgi:chemotaxis-related protein WspB
MLFLVFRLGEDRYAIDTAAVVEVLPLVHVKQVPRSPPGVAGVFDYHGAPVPLIDLADLILGRPSRKWMSTRIVLVNYEVEPGQTHLLGVLAEQATDTVSRTAEDFTDPGVAGRDTPYLGPVTRDEAGMIQRVDIHSLLPEGLRDQLFRARLGRD